jgi:hypothetical protein
MATREDAARLWAGTMMCQPTIWNDAVSEKKQAEDLKIAMQEAGIDLAFQLLNKK